MSPREVAHGGGAWLNVAASADLTGLYHEAGVNHQATRGNRRSDVRLLQQETVSRSAHSAQVRSGSWLCKNADGLLP